MFRVAINLDTRPRCPPLFVVMPETNARDFTSDKTLRRLARLFSVLHLHSIASRAGRRGVAAAAQGSGERRRRARWLGG